MTRFLLMDVFLLVGFLNDYEFSTITIESNQLLNKIDKLSSTVMNQLHTSRISSDLPIAGSTEDKFAFAPFAKEVVAHIFSEEQPESLVVGLSGRWGSGKTSLLNLIDEQLACLKINEKEIITLRYVPWRVEDRKSMLGNFLPLLTEKIEGEFEKSPVKSSNFSDLFQPVKTYVKAIENAEPALKALAKTLSAFGFSFLEKGLEVFKDVNSAMNEEKTPDIEYLHRSAYEALLELKIPVVVMIDDIDRLEPNEIVDLLRLVRATAQLPYITFILAYDQTHVISAVGDVLKVDGQEFVEKFVQLPIAVPVVDQSTLETIVRDRLTELFAGLGAAPYFIENKERTIYDVVDTIKKARTISTPRDVNRILNTINFRINSTIDELKFSTIIYMSVIQTKFPLLFEWLSIFVEKNKKDLKNATNGVNYDLADVKKFVEPYSSDFTPVETLVENTLASFRMENTI